MSLSPKEMVYRYKPLTEPDAIRLIELQPCPNISAQVQCRLIHTTLERAREEIIEHYTALSYVWGDPDDRTQIFVDSLPIHVAKNLDDALRHIRDPTRILHVWTDAVYINQEDLIERNQQVAQMGEIYKSAHHTVIFLGTCDAEIEAALSHTPRRSFRQSFTEMELNEDFIRAIKGLSSRPWFYRVWIFQELALSHDPRVQCGRFRCSRDDFYRLASNLQSKRKHLSLLTSQAPNKYMDILNSMQSAIEYCRETKPKNRRRYAEYTKLFEILQARRGFGVSDDRDMIFAHLGLFPKDMIEVDYGLNTVEIFERIAMAYVETVESLDILHYREDVDPRKRREGLASWAPDWSSNSFSSITEEPYNLGRNWGLRTFFIRSPNLMCSTASIISTITSLSCQLEDITMPEGLGVNSSPIFKELMFKNDHIPSIIDDRKLALLSMTEPPSNSCGAIPGNGVLGIVPKFSRIGDKICVLLGCATAIVIRDVVGVIDEKVDPRVRTMMKEIMKEPEGSKRHVRHVQIIGNCKVDYLQPVDRFSDSGLLYRGKRLPEGDALLAIH